MSLSFSQRYGYKEVRDVFQIHEIDEELKNGIWNALQITCLNGTYHLDSNFATNDQWLIDLCGVLWTGYFKERIHRLPRSWYSFEEELEHYFYEVAQWYDIYDLIEFISKKITGNSYDEYKIEINIALEEEMSGFRLIGKKITPIVDEVEIQSIESAINNSELKHVSIHIESALKLMSDRENPSYRNSIKESISAVEGVAKLITNDKKATLKPALDKLDELLSMPLHGGLKAGFLNIYGYTSDGDGIRHALTENTNISFEDAKFMLVACSAFVNYLISKAGTVGIEIKE